MTVEKTGKMEAIKIRYTKGIEIECVNKIF